MLSVPHASGVKRRQQKSVKGEKDGKKKSTSQFEDTMVEVLNE